MAEIHLSPREQQVLSGIAAGQTTEYIAYQLGISRKTVGHYIESLRRKLEAPSTICAVARAVALGLVNVQFTFVIEALTTSQST